MKKNKINSALITVILLITTINCNAQSSADNRARKSELKAELRIIKKDLDKLFGAKMFRDKDIKMLRANGFEYEAAAKRVNLQEAKRKFDEYKSVNNGVSFGASSIQSIDYLIENYDQFARDIIAQKVRKLLDDSYDKNQIGSSDLRSSNLSKEALAYLNGAMKFSGIKELIALKKEATGRMGEVSTNLDGALTGNFHKLHKGELFFAKKYIPYNKLGSVSKSDFSTNFESGDELWAYFFAPGSVGQIGNSNRTKNSIISANKNYNGVMQLTLQTKALGREKMIFYTMPILEPGQDLNKSVIIIPLLPGQSYFQTAAFKKVKNGGKKFASVYEKMKEYPPRKIEFEITYDNDPYWTGIETNKKITIAVDRAYYQKMFDQCNNIAVASVRLEKKTGSNPAVETRIKKAASKYGTVLVVNQFTSTAVHKNAITGIPEYSYQHYQAVYKSSDGNCYILKYEHKKNYVGGSWKDAGIERLTYDPTTFKIQCANVN